LPAVRNAAVRRGGDGRAPSREYGRQEGRHAEQRAFLQQRQLRPPAQPARVPRRSVHAVGADPDHGGPVASAEHIRHLQRQRPPLRLAPDDEGDRGDAGHLRDSARHRPARGRGGAARVPPRPARLRGGRVFRLFAVHPRRAARQHDVAHHESGGAGRVAGDRPASRRRPGARLARHLAPGHRRPAGRGADRLLGRAEFPCPARCSPWNSATSPSSRRRRCWRRPSSAW